MAISYNEALEKLATITDETGLRALIEQLDAAGDQSSRVTVLWTGTQDGIDSVGDDRSEERRVGKECRSRWSPYH